MKFAQQVLSLPIVQKSESKHFHGFIDILDMVCQLIHIVKMPSCLNAWFCTCVFLSQVALVSSEFAGYHFHSLHELQSVSVLQEKLAHLQNSRVYFIDLHIESKFP